jgi:antitoxin HicB
MLDYPVTLTPDDNDTILVSFVDLPAHTFGNDPVDALRHAVEALATILDAYIKDGREIPGPSKGKIRVIVPALIEAKIRLYETMRAEHVTKAELGRRLDWHAPQVDRLLAMTHSSQFDQLEAAFMAMSKRLVVDVLDVAPLKKAGAEKVRPARRLAAGKPSYRTNTKRG